MRVPQGLSKNLASQRDSNPPHLILQISYLLPLLQFQEMRNPSLPASYVASVLLVALYLGRLIVLDPISPAILVPALMNGFLVNPAFYLWLGPAPLRRS